jgi:hypothetical protein
MEGISTMQVHGKCTIAVICELINVDVKLSGCGKTNKHCWFAHNLKLNILNANNTTQEFYISHK